LAQHFRQDFFGAAAHVIDKAVHRPVFADRLVAHAVFQGIDQRDIESDVKLIFGDDLELASVLADHFHDFEPRVHQLQAMDAGDDHVETGLKVFFLDSSAQAHRAHADESHGHFDDAAPIGGVAEKKDHDQNAGGSDLFHWACPPPRAAAAAAADGSMASRSTWLDRS